MDGAPSDWRLVGKEQLQVPRLPAVARDDKLNTGDRSDGAGCIRAFPPLTSSRMGHPAVWRAIFVLSHSLTSSRMGNSGTRRLPCPCPYLPGFFGQTPCNHQ